MLSKKTTTAGSHLLFWAGCLFSLSVSTAEGAGPIPFNGFTVTDGVVSATCPPPATNCTDVAADNGFLQREVTTASGTYLQFILTDPNVTGDAQAIPFTSGSLGFINEDFVKMNNNSGGIASSQLIAESKFITPTLEDRFVNLATYSFGVLAGNPYSDPWVKVHQDISQLDYSAGPTNPTELMYSIADISRDAGSSVLTEHTTGLAQMVKVGNAATDVQKFRYQSEDYFNTFCHNSTDPACGSFYPDAGSPSPLLPGGTNGGDISWVGGQQVTATWVGQNVNTGGDPLVFGYTSYANIYDATSTSLTSLTNPDPINWGNPFGPAPDPLTSTRTVTATVAPVLATPTGSVAAGTAASGSTPVSLPIPFDGWTVSGGAFTVASCAGCGGAIVNGGGVYQRMITVGSDQYFQTIVTDKNATGDPTLANFDTNSLAFKQESLVKSNTDGIAANLNIATVSTPNPYGFETYSSTVGKFQYNAKLKTGWAHGQPLDPTIEINQSVITPATNPFAIQSTSMWDTFYLAQGETANDKIMDIQAYVGQNTPLTSDFYVLNTPIMFRTNIVQGAFQTTTHTLADASLLSSGGNIAWAPGDAIQATWLGAYYSTPDPGGPDTVGATSYTNLSTGASTAYSSVRTQAGDTTASPFPNSWVSPFLPYPSFLATYIGGVPLWTYPGLLTPQ